VPAIWRRLTCSICGHPMKDHDPICGRLERRPGAKPRYATGYVKGGIWFERCVCQHVEMVKAQLTKLDAQNRLKKAPRSR